MSTFLELLPLELKQINNFIEPEDEVKEGETIVGEMGNDHKSLYTLSRYKSKESLDIRASLMVCRDNQQEKIANAESLKAKAVLLMEIFWICIKDDLNLWDNTDTIGVRRGFKVVSYKDQTSHYPPIIRGLLGLQ